MSSIKGYKASYSKTHYYVEGESIKEKVSGAVVDLVSSQQGVRIYKKDKPSLLAKILHKLIH